MDESASGSRGKVYLPAINISFDNIGFGSFIVSRYREERPVSIHVSGEIAIYITVGHAITGTVYLVFIDIY
jgi:hypothetical protein